MQHDNGSFCISLKAISQMPYDKNLSAAIAWANENLDPSAKMEDFPDICFNLDAVDSNKFMYYLAAWTNCIHSGEDRITVNRGEFRSLSNKLHTLWKLEVHRRYGFFKDYTHRDILLVETARTEFHWITAEISERYFTQPVPYHLASIKEELRHHLPSCKINIIHSAS